MLAERKKNFIYEPMKEHGEFNNRAAARLYVKDMKFNKDVYLIRKEVSIFYDRKLDEKVD
jgi:hypothetical protein